MFMAEDLPKEFDKHLFGYKKYIFDGINAKYGWVETLFSYIWLIFFL